MALVLKFQFGEEIRRITTEKQLAFNEVIDLAKALFRGHLPASIALKYKDDEGDIITVGTQRELEEAYRVSKDGILRFMITEGKIPLPQESSTSSVPNDVMQLLESTIRQVSRTPNGIQLLLSSLLNPPPASSTTATLNLTDDTTTCNNAQTEESSSVEPEIKITVDIVPDEEKPLHPARCDSCQKQIKGIRYKCKDCPDYDLCEVCEPNKAGIHSSKHSFMKIPKPTWKKPEKEPEPPKTQPTPPPQYPLKTPEMNPPTVEPVKDKPEPSQPVPIPQPITPEPLNKQTEKPAEKPAEKPTEKPVEQKPVGQKSEPKKEPETKKPTLFEDHERKLQDMGFTDKSRNLALLIQENGNLVEVVKHLLDG